MWRAHLMATEWPLGQRGRLAVSLRIELHWRLCFSLQLALERIFMSADSVAESLVETLIRIGGPVHCRVAGKGPLTFLPKAGWSANENGSVSVAIMVVSWQRRILWFPACRRCGFDPVRLPFFSDWSATPFISHSLHANRSKWNAWRRLSQNRISCILPGYASQLVGSSWSSLSLNQIFRQLQLTEKSGLNRNTADSKKVRKNVWLWQTRRLRGRLTVICSNQETLYYS